MKVITAPNKGYGHLGTTIFLAGSIEMGTAVDWQSELINELKDIQELTLFNPRRDDWDSSWTQSINNPQFKEQVTWELSHIDKADVVVFYFASGTQSPITLMELGYAIMRKRILVYCPDDFWRKGNIEVMMSLHHHSHNLFDDKSKWIETIKRVKSTPKGSWIEP